MIRSLGAIGTSLTPLKVFKNYRQTIKYLPGLTQNAPLIFPYSSMKIMIYLGHIRVTLLQHGFTVTRRKIAENLV